MLNSPISSSEGDPYLYGSALLTLKSFHAIFFEFLFYKYTLLIILIRKTNLDLIIWGPTIQIVDPQILANICKNVKVMTDLINQDFWSASIKEFSDR